MDWEQKLASILLNCCTVSVFGLALYYFACIKNHTDLEAFQYFAWLTLLGIGIIIIFKLNELLKEKK